MNDSAPAGSTAASIPASSPTKIITTSLPANFSSLASTPTGISLPTGDFELFIPNPSYDLNACVNNESEADAWSCSVSGHSTYQMKITGQTKGSYTLSLGTRNATSEVLTYGLQGPVVTITGGTLGIDLNFPSRGPIYLFQAIFDNVVIVPESEFTPANTKVRGLENYGSVFIRKRNIVQLGERPWFCSWNGTLLDISIYANETSYGGSQWTSTSLVNSTATPTSTYASSSSPSTQALSAYPKVVGVENSFEISTTNPYCTQYQILSDGSAVRLQPTSGSNPIHEIKTNSTNATSCGCQWLVL